MTSRPSNSYDPSPSSTTKFTFRIAQTILPAPTHALVQPGVSAHIEAGLMLQEHKEHIDKAQREQLQHELRRLGARGPVDQRAGPAEPTTLVREELAVESSHRGSTRIRVPVALVVDNEDDKKDLEDLSGHLGVLQGEGHSVSIFLDVNCTPAQMLFRVAQLRGVTPLSGTTSEQHMKEDVAVENINLEETSDGQVISALEAVTSTLDGKA
ncbi:hypothetical protein CERSUDRAFT_98230 [Gelatoporia subvermispora B]|uniref:Uncharacterized protein n=1 Tax=Ceriporiopsis subvermispora (strain B) TaxID=914234 RepID=M2Q9U9_CERS8|nr:hypothetical protein CERSUDRAFT_98230 [Gelatoporia subvermispora B]